MTSIVAILLVAALNMIPDGVGTFSLTTPDNKPIQFIKQADGGWKGVKEDKAEAPLFYVHGTELTMKTAEKEFTNNLAETLGVTKETNWRELKEFKVGAQPMQVERRSDGLDFVIKSKQEDKVVERRYLVRWGAAAKAQ